VQAALKSVEGVENPQVSMPDKASYDGDAKPEEVIAAIKKAGFEAELRK